LSGLADCAEADVLGLAIGPISCRQSRSSLGSFPFGAFGPRLLEHDEGAHGLAVVGSGRPTTAASATIGLATSADSIYRSGDGDTLSTSSINMMVK
jgi:hypothetical protein